MDPRVLAHVHGDTSAANVHPRTRRRYPAPLSLQGSRPVASPAGTPSLLIGAAEGTWRCPGSGYSYSESAGHPREGLAAGTRGAVGRVL
jgi:alkane 1-monooxygenase